MSAVLKGFITEGNEVIIRDKVVQISDNLNEFIGKVNKMSDDAAKYMESNRLQRLDSLYSSIVVFVTTAGKAFTGAVNESLQQLVKDAEEEGVTYTENHVPEVIRAIDDIEFSPYSMIEMTETGEAFTDDTLQTCHEEVRKCINDFYEVFTGMGGIMKEISDSNEQYSTAIPMAYRKLYNCITRLGELYMENAIISQEAVESATKAIKDMASKAEDYISSDASKNLENVIEEGKNSIRSNIPKR